eukprot:5228256-Pleurochrysis_carterae.AAC.1
MLHIPGRCYSKANLNRYTYCTMMRRNIMKFLDGIIWGVQLPRNIDLKGTGRKIYRRQKRRDGREGRRRKKDGH